MVGARATVGAATVPVVGSMKPVAGAMVPVEVAGAVAVEVEVEVADDGEVIEMLFCLLVALACVDVLFFPSHFGNDHVPIFYFCFTFWDFSLWTLSAARIAKSRCCFLASCNIKNT